MVAPAIVTPLRRSRRSPDIIALAAHGVIVLHISNRHTALWRPVAAVGNAEGSLRTAKTASPRHDQRRIAVRTEVIGSGCDGISAICQRSQDGSASIPIRA
jgi:hypothetical protein